MSSIEAKLALLPKSIPITFQFGTGPTINGSLINDYNTIKGLQVLSDNKIRHLHHFINSYAIHHNQNHIAYLTDVEVFLSFVVASGSGGGRKLKSLLIEEPVSNESLRYIGKVDPVCTAINTLMNQLNVTEGKEARVAAATELMKYLKTTGLEFTKVNPKFQAVVLEKCEEFRQQLVREFPELVKVCTDLIVALGLTPAPLISGVRLVMRLWNNVLPDAVEMGLQLNTGPLVKGIVYPKTYTVLTSFYPEPVPIHKWYHKYVKTYGQGKLNPSLVEIINHLSIGAATNVYILLENWEPSNSSFVIQATAEDEARIREPAKQATATETATATATATEEESDAGPCDCAGCTFYEPPCDCRTCEQEKQINELFDRTNKLYCAFIVNEDAEYCDCVRCKYENTLQEHIKALENQINVISKHLKIE